MKSSKIIAIHISFWVLNTMFNFIFWGLEQSISIFCMILPFYINYIYFVPKILVKNKASNIILWFILVWATMISTFIGYYLISESIFYHNLKPNFKTVFAISGYISFYYISISTGGRLFIYWLENIKKNNELIRQKTINQVQLMKSNINIPFVVNTLTYIHSISQIKPSNAEVPIINLSNILRYGLYETQSDFNPIYREIEILNDYVDLQNQIETKFKLIVNTKLLTENTPVIPNIIVRFIGFWREQMQDYLVNEQEIMLSSKSNTIELKVPLHNYTNLNSLKSTLYKNFPTYVDDFFSVSYTTDNNYIILKIINLKK